MTRHIFSSRSLLCVGAGFAAFLVGLRLDQRLRSVPIQEPHAMVRPEIFQQATHEGEVRARIEKVSGVKGTLFFAPDEWVPAEPVIVEGVDVSDLFAGEFVLKRSLQADFRFSKAIVEATFTRPDTFVDLGIPVSPDAWLVLRFSNGGIKALRRMATGTFEPVSPDINREPLPQCARYEVVASEGKLEAVCEGKTMLRLGALDKYHGRVFVASNLMRGEVRELKIEG